MCVEMMLCDFCIHHSEYSSTCTPFITKDYERIYFIVLTFDDPANETSVIAGLPSISDDITSHHITSLDNESFNSINKIIYHTYTLELSFAFRNANINVKQTRGDLTVRAQPCSILPKVKSQR
jgi:hypothetical protein